MDTKRIAERVASGMKRVGETRDDLDRKLNALLVFRNDITDVLTNFKDFGGRRDEGSARLVKEANDLIANISEEMGRVRSTMKSLVLHEKADANKAFALALKVALLKYANTDRDISSPEVFEPDDQYVGAQYSYPYKDVNKRSFDMEAERCESFLWKELGSWSLRIVNFRFEPNRQGVRFDVRLEG